MSTVRSRAFAVLVSMVVLLGLGAGAALAAPGDLDSTWSGDGIAINTNSGSGAPARVAPLPDGRVMASADCLGATSAQIFDFCVYRYNADGALDTTFDGDGIARTDFGDTFDTPWAVAVQSDGKVVAGGQCGPNPSYVMCLARYNTDGTLDATFDGDGRVTTGGFTSNGRVSGRGLVIQPDGRIVLAGTCDYSSPTFQPIRDACLARYNTDGSLDTTFSGDGRALLDLGSANDDITAAALQSGGGIVIGGSCPPASAAIFCIARVTSGGSLDGSFGVVATAMGVGASSIHDLAIAGTDQIVAAGQCTAVQFGSPTICVTRYSSGGALDATFDGDGRAIGVGGHNVGGAAGGSAVALQTNGKILVANGCANPGFTDFCLVRMNTDGTLDASFGTGGIVLTSVEPTGNNDWANDVAVAANGKILAAGACYYPMCIARYGGDPVVDTEAPVISITVDAADTPAGTGWYNAATSGTNGVLIRVSAVDDTAVTNLTCTDGATTVLNTSAASGSFVLGDGSHSISCTASDGINAAGAGSGSTAMPVAADVDQVAPTVACFSQTLLFRASVGSIKLADISDATSGTLLVEWNETNPDTSTAGLHTIPIGVDDEAGNVRNTSCNYAVHYVFAGFAAPISSGSFDYVTAVTGKIIPFRFTLTDANGQAVLGVTGVTLIEAAGTCTGTNRTLATSDYAKGKVGLFGSNGSYEFRYKAPRQARGQCVLITLALPDGTTHSATIRFQ